MGAVRKYSPHVRWSDEELSELHRIYATGAWPDILSALPGRTKSQIRNRANEIPLVRLKPPKMTAAERAEGKRRSIAKRRAENPEATRAYQRKWLAENKDQVNARWRAIYQKRFFWARASKLRGPDRATHREIAALWKHQRGRCALTGRRLDRTAELDHILPKTRGGRDNIENLRWLTEEVNTVKRNLTDAEFVLLCADVLRVIGERIDMVDEL